MSVVTDYLLLTAYSGVLIYLAIEDWQTSWVNRSVLWVACMCGALIALVNDTATSALFALALIIPLILLAEWIAQHYLSMSAADGSMGEGDIVVLLSIALAVGYQRLALVVLPVTLLLMGIHTYMRQRTCRDNNSPYPPSKLEQEGIAIIPHLTIVTLPLVWYGLLGTS